MDIKSNNRQTGAGIASTSASTGASDNTSQNINTGLNSFSYADFVLLSSTISYAIAEEVSVEDLEILVESGMNVKRLLVNNMRELTKEDARKLYLEIM